MAFQEHAISAITDIPALVAAFATARGWTVSGTNITRPGGGLTFAITANIVGYDHFLQASETGSTATSVARFISPKLAGTRAVPIVSIPSKVYLFGDTSPEPFIAVVVEYAYNQYRHLYIGNMVKASAYTGGECISATQPLLPAVNQSSGYRSSAYLFGGRQRAQTKAQSGGLRAVHANNPTPWREFYTTTSLGPTSPNGVFSTFDSVGAIGGFGDDINDGYLACAKATFSNAQILVPVNLYAPQIITGDTRFAPLGYPAGVRMVHMEDIDPGFSFTIGAQTWQCFPAFRKSTLTTVAGTVGWAAEESSYWVGYAYPRD